MNIPVASVLVLIFILWLNYEIKKNNKASKSSLDHFWQKEKDANLTRRQDISALKYLSVSLETLPMGDHEDDTLNSYRDMIRNYANRKMINLSGLTNTDLKLMYGVANFHLLSEYDNNYTAFISMLQKWAKRLYDRGYEKEAQAVLEFSIFSCLTDVTLAYLLLAELYQKQGQPQKRNELIDIIPQTKIKDKEKLMEELNSKDYAMKR